VPGCAPRAPLLPSAFDTAQLFAGTVRFGQAQGDIRPDVNADVAGRLLLDAYLGILYRWSPTPTVTTALRCSTA
jgi:hypothetical protein